VDCPTRVPDGDRVCSGSRWVTATANYNLRPTPIRLAVLSTDITMECCSNSSSSSSSKRLFHYSARWTSGRRGRRYETGATLLSSPPPPPAYHGTHALARTRDAYGRRVQWVKHLRPLPCDKAAAIPPRRGCTTARVQHPAVKISETGLGDEPPERDPYTIKIARVGTYEYDNTTTTTTTTATTTTRYNNGILVYTTRVRRGFWRDDRYDNIVVVLPDETQKN